MALDWCQNCVSVQYLGNGLIEVDPNFVFALILTRCWVGWSLPGIHYFLLVFSRITKMSTVAGIIHCLCRFCRTCFSMGDLGVQVSIRLFVRPSVNIYPGCLVSATPFTALYQSFWNFACVFVMVWGCACGLDIIVRLFFVCFSTLWT